MSSDIVSPHLMLLSLRSMEEPVDSAASALFVRPDWQHLNHAVFLAGREHILGIHREAPSFIEQGTEQEILETGIKVIRLLRVLSILDAYCADNAF
jgi:F0F1-type ATP synthase beta subunit